MTELQNHLKKAFWEAKSDMKMALIDNNESDQLLQFMNLLDSLQETKRFQVPNNDLLVEMERFISEYFRKKAIELEQDNNFTATNFAFMGSLLLQQNEETSQLFALHLFKSMGFLLNRKIDENMELINPYNVRDIVPLLKLVKKLLKVVMKDPKVAEETRQLIAFIELIEKEIKNSEYLQQSLDFEEEEISIERALSELNRLIGMQTVKTKVREISDWISFSKLRSKEGLKVDKLSYHMVFSGNPGTGKTTVARLIAQIYKSLGVLKKGHLVEVGRSDLVAEYVGQTAMKTMAKIKEAEHGILFVDEAYSLVRSKSNDFGMEAIDTLVKAMEDKRGSLVVILAGYPAEMERFIKSNPGLYSRFKYHIEFPDYSANELLKILQKMLIEKQYRMNEPAFNIALKMIKRVMIKKPNEHGNGRLVRNILEDAIIKKASHTLLKAQNNNSDYDLDLIDEEIMNLVERDSLSS